MLYGTSAVDYGLSLTATMHTTSLVAKLGQENAEKLTMMKERNEQNGWIVTKASEKHSIRKEIDVSKIVTMHW